MSRVENPTYQQPPNEPAKSFAASVSELRASLGLGGEIQAGFDQVTPTLYIGQKESITLNMVRRAIENEKVASSLTPEGTQDSVTETDSVSRQKKYFFKRALKLGAKLSSGFVQTVEETGKLALRFPEVSGSIGVFFTTGAWLKFGSDLALSNNELIAVSGIAVVATNGIRIACEHLFPKNETTVSAASPNARHKKTMLRRYFLKGCAIFPVGLGIKAIVDKSEGKTGCIDTSNPLLSSEAKQRIEEGCLPAIPEAEVEPTKTNTVQPPEKAVNEQAYSPASQRKEEVTSHPSSNERPRALWRSAERKPGTGIKLLEDLGLLNRMVYMIYGRPRGWGSIGETRTPEEALAMLDQRHEQILELLSQEVKGDSEDKYKVEELFGMAQNPAYKVVDVVAYSGPNHNLWIGDTYITDLFALVHKKNTQEVNRNNQWLVSLDCPSIDKAEKVVEFIETNIPQEQRKYCTISLDIEHFPEKTVVAGSSIGTSTTQEINAFSKYFGQKHLEWNFDDNIPGFVFTYMFHPNQQVPDLANLNQYHIGQKTLTIPIFDGWGEAGVKVAKLYGIRKTVRDLPEFPSLLGIMETYLQHPGKYNETPTIETAKCLYEAPVRVLASQ